MPVVNNVKFPSWGAVLGWLMVGGVAIWIPIVFFIQWCMKGGWGVIKQAAKPAENWGPADPEDRKNTRYILPELAIQIQNTQRNSYMGNPSISSSENWNLVKRNGLNHGNSVTSQL